MPVTIADVLAALSVLCPNATVGDDNDGQLIIYTDLRVTDDDTLVPFESEA